MCLVPNQRFILNKILGSVTAETGQMDLTLTLSIALPEYRFPFLVSPSPAGPKNADRHLVSSILELGRRYSLTLIIKKGTKCAN